MRLIRLIIAAGALCAPGVIMAQTATYALDAQVGQVCGAYNDTGQTVTVDFGALANTPPNQFVSRVAGDITYRCNLLTGFTRTIASQNSGFMTLAGQPTSEAARRIRFTMRHRGVSGFGFQQLAAPRVTTHRDSATNRRFLNGQTARVWFRAYGVRGTATAGAPAGTRVFAGEYRDTVTLTITAN